MSEYQYYEFRAIDRPLTRQQMDELRGWSTRATITSTSFQNEYHWGDFKGDPLKFVQKYFDAHVYLANWGTRVLMLGFPRDMIDTNAVQAYFGGESASVSISGDRIVMSWDIQNEGEWTEQDDGWMDRLVPLRQMIVRGDRRALYLGWLLDVQNGPVDDDDVEPPVPNGLKDLSEPLDDLIEFLEIDEDLVAAAAEASGPITAVDDSAAMRTWVANLPASTKTDMLLAVLNGRAVETEAQLRLGFTRHQAGSAINKPERTGGRTAGALRERASEIGAVREQAEREAVDVKRRRDEARRRVERNAELDALAKHSQAVWTEIDAKVSTGQSARYDEAAKSLKDLHDLAQRDGSLPAFLTQLRSLIARHVRKGSFVRKASVYLGNP